MVNSTIIYIEKEKLKKKENYLPKHTRIYAKSSVHSKHIRISSMTMHFSLQRFDLPVRFYIWYNPVWFFLSHFFNYSFLIFNHRICFVCLNNNKKKILRQPYICWIYISVRKSPSILLLSLFWFSSFSLSYLLLSMFLCPCYFFTSFSFFCNQCSFWS